MTVELFARSLAFVAKRVNSNPNSLRPWTNLLCNVFKRFAEFYLASKDVHTSTSTIDLDVRKTVTFSYFKVLMTLESSTVTDVLRQPPSALFAVVEVGDASFLVVRAPTRSILTNSPNCTTPTPHTSNPSSRPSLTNFLPPSLSVHPPIITASTRWLFLAGSRAQNAFPVVSPESLPTRSRVVHICREEHQPVYQMGM